MTFCLGIKVDEGLVGIADTRILSGNEMVRGRKVFTYKENGSCMFLMTSGLRSLTDKMLNYFDHEVMRGQASPYPRLYQAANGIANQIRRVSREDRQALERGGLSFNIHCILGGQLAEDEEHKLFLIYPEANWVEIEESTPYQSVGARAYSKALLDRALDYRDTLRYATKIAYLAFNSTRVSAVDVDFPLDFVLYRRDSHEIIEHRFEEADLKYVSEWWNDNFRLSVKNLPADWLEAPFAKLDAAGGGKARRVS